MAAKRGGLAATVAASQMRFRHSLNIGKLEEDTAMGLLSGLLGLASDVDVGDVRRDLEPMLVPSEEIDLAFAVVRDLMVFTSHRLILVDKQGMTGRKREYHSIPYRSITMFSVETAGSFDTDSELKIWISSQGAPLVRPLSRQSNISGIQRALAEGVLGGRR